MDKTDKKITTKLTPYQIAQVGQDLEKAKTFFKEIFSVYIFSPTITTCLQNYDGTYFVYLTDAENLVTMTYTGGTFIEIIQPIAQHHVSNACQKL